MDKKWNEDAKKQIEEKKGSKKAQEKSEGRELNYMRYLSDAERDVIKAMQTKLDKPIFNTKIRILYIAPKDKISLARLGGIIGSFKIFGGTNFNSFKPNKFVTTTQQSRFSDKLESNRVKKLVLWKKRDFIKNFKKRQISSGGKNMHLATNEIATMYHFPLEVVRRATVERVDARKGEPPANIPL